MSELAGFVAYLITVYAAVTYHDYRRHQSRCAAYRARATRLQHMRGTQ